MGSICLCGRTLPAWQMAHHLGHVALAYYLSPFEEADVLSLDGGGNFTFGLLCRAKGIDFERVANLNRQNIGWFWNALAARIFGAMSAAGKVMGLAPFGEPVYEKALYARFGRWHAGVNGLWMNDFPDHTRPVPFFKIGLKGRPDILTREEENMARSLQEVTNSMAVAVLRKHSHAPRSKNLCLSGGVALNCVMNEAIRLERLYEQIFVPSAPNDAGLSMGFAFYLWHNIMRHPRIAGKAWHPYRGMPHPRSAVVEAARFAQAKGLTVQPIAGEAEQNAAVVQLVDAQKIVGIHRGRSESGPRALGHRSIVADPRNAQMKDVINAKVKFREAFRPFAPSVLLENVGQYTHFDGRSPYMSFAPLCNPYGQAKIPATVHIDGTARLQTVDSTDNPDFYRLIKAFASKTGVHALLNTSLNTKGEPINESPRHSLDTLLNSELDALLIDDFLFTKPA